MGSMVDVISPGGSVTFDFDPTQKLDLSLV